MENPEMKYRKSKGIQNISHVSLKIKTKEMVCEDPILV